MVQAVKHGILEVILRRKTALTVIVDTWALDWLAGLVVKSGGNVSGNSVGGSGDVEGTLMLSTP